MESMRENPMKAVGKTALQALAWVLTVSLYMAFNYIPPVGGVILLLLLASLLLSGKQTTLPEYICAGVAAVCLVLGMLTHRYSLRMVCVSLAAAACLGLLILGTRAKMRAGTRAKWGAVLGVVGYIASGALCVFLVANVLNPSTLIIPLQGGAGDYPQNVTEWSEQQGDVKIYRDVTYDSDYANNTYTVYTLPDSKGVFFYIHGGGLVIGDKEAESQNVYLQSVMDAGYSVVTVDYVLAPQNPFPQSVCEVNDALAYFLRHADAYDLTTERVIVGGDSAGGMLSGLLAVINTNPDYAAQMGITPAVSGTDVTLRGYVSISGLVDVTRFSQTGQFLVDWAFDSMARAAFQTADYADTEAAHLGSVLEHVTADFPPTYCSDGNLGSFADQGRDLIAKLTELGVPNDSNFPGRDAGVLYPGLQTFASRQMFGQVRVYTRVFAVGKSFCMRV